MRLLGVVCLCVVGLGAGVDGQVQEKDGPMVVSASGSFKGSWMMSRRGRRFEAYRGIRYADPPIGKLRFQPPNLIYKYWRTVNATVDGPMCPQPAAPGDYVDEDCLMLNVYSPKTSKPDNRSKLLPVVVFIHSGGLYSDSGRSDMVGPQYVMDRDLVLVTINYRLGALGFLSTGDDQAPGNNGFKDQVTALLWVRRNIAAFGGHPRRITLLGTDAGAYSVGLHMVSPTTKGLFHRAISMSGSPYSQVKIPNHQRGLAEKQARLVGCPSNSSKVIIDCLKTVPWKEITDSLIKFTELAHDPVIIWKPVVEPDVGQKMFLPRHPLEVLRKRKVNSVPYIIGQTQDEFFWKAFIVLSNTTLTTQLNEDWDRLAPISFMLPDDSGNATQRLKEAYLKDKPLVSNSTTAYSLGRLYSDSITGFSVHRLANIMCRVSEQPVFYYQFSYLGNHSFYEDPATNKSVAVSHLDDLIYLFPVRVLFPDVPLTGTDAVMVEKMTAILYNVARYGDPNPRSDTPELADLSWPRMEPVQRQYLRISSNFTVLQKQSEERFQLWDQLYPIE